MKKSMAVAVMLGVLAPAAWAQSSVSLYGRIDAGLEYLNNVTTAPGQTSTRWSAEGGDWGTSMLGLRGNEDLGGGLAAVFNLETALQVMNGTTGGGRLFSRRAYVGLKDDTWGQLQAGRNLFIDSDGVWAYDPLQQQAVSSASLVRGRNWQQTSNNVEYHSPVFHGFDVQAQYAFGNQASGFNNGAAGEFGRSNGVMLSYTSQYFDLRGLYDELRDSNGQFSNIFTSSREYFVGGNLRVSQFKIQTAWTHYAAPDTPAGLADSADQFWLGATWQATPSWDVTGAGYYVRVRGGDGDATHDPAGRATLYALSTTYHISPRTFFYGTVGYVRNGSQSNFSVFATPLGATPTTNPLIGQSQVTTYVGMMHSF